MLAGPIFARELTVAARRRGTFGLRAAIASLLLIALGANYYGWEAWTEGKYTVQDITWFACTAFCSLVVLQGILTIMIVPGLVGSSIAEEKERKTLHYLLCSDLKAPEIVLGKLATSMLQYTAGLSAGLPVLSLLTLLGGVDPAWVFLAYGGTLSTAYAIGGLAILMSVLCRRTRGALNATRSISMLWLVGTAVLTVLSWFSAIPRIFRPITNFVSEWVLPSSPLNLLLRARGLMSGGAHGLVGEVAWMAGLQIAAGTMCIALAVWRLRPVFRAQEGSAGRDGSAKQRRRRHRPACGDDPILWKECYPARLSRVATIFKFALIAAFVGGFGYGTLSYVIPIVAQTFGGDWGNLPLDAVRARFLLYLRIMTGFVFTLYALLVLSDAACNITSEKERDTWDNLMTTPLSHMRLLVAKMRGAAWQQRWFLWLLIGSWTAGLLTLSVHPLSMLAVMVETCVFIWYVTALGTWASLMGKNTSQASGLAAALLMGPNVITIAIAAALRTQTMYAYITCMPIIEGVSIFSADELGRALGGEGMAVMNLAGEGPGTALIVCLAGLLIYGLGAAGFTYASFVMFDRAVGRPRRDHEQSSRDCHVPSPRAVLAVTDA
jgi:ABC-type Na+ efflux pump permease subunit